MYIHTLNVLNYIIGVTVVLTRYVHTHSKRAKLYHCVPVVLTRYVHTHTLNVLNYIIGVPVVLTRYVHTHSKRAKLYHWCSSCSNTLCIYTL